MQNAGLGAALVVTLLGPNAAIYRFAGMLTGAASRSSGLSFRALNRQLRIHQNHGWILINGNSSWNEAGDGRHQRRAHQSCAQQNSVG